ncbi:hypothetical protein AAFC00_006528 [Neodothiora populina]|uniref:Uncharacterized protein n=1 Tax=Neodothiora populina TaxID=2781224 RepID=A0ABR3PAD2_9PEZI
MGSRATLFSTITNATAQIPPNTNIEMTIGDSHWKPHQSTTCIPCFNETFPGFPGSSFIHATEVIAARGQMTQNKPRHVDFCTNAAATEGPTMLPNPTIEPRMPWYLPRSCRDTMSDTVTMVSDVMPPEATPERPRKTYSIVELTANPHRRSLTESSINADIKITFRPMGAQLCYCQQPRNIMRSE